MQNFEIRRWRETVTVATASCVLAYENLDLPSSPAFDRSVILQVLLTCARILRSTIYGLTRQSKTHQVIKLGFVLLFYDSHTDSLWPSLTRVKSGQAQFDASQNGPASQVGPGTFAQWSLVTK